MAADPSPARRLTPTVIAGFAAALLALALVGVLGIQRVAAAASARAWVEHTHEVLDALAAVRASSDESVATARISALTREPPSTALTALGERAHARIDRVALLTRDNPAQQVRIPALHRLMTAHFAHLRGASGAVDAANDAVDPVNALIATMRDTERALLTAREAREAHATVRLRAQVLLGVSAGWLVCLAVLATLWRDAGRRQHAERERDALFGRMQEAHEELEAQNEELLQQSEDLVVQSEQLARHSDALHGARDYLEAVLAHLADGVIAFDEHGHVMLCNAAAQQMLGLPHAAVAVEDWAAYAQWRAADGRVALDDDDTPVARVRCGDTVTDREVVLAPARRRAHGRVRTLLTSGRPLRDRTGNYRGAILALHDITDRKAAERLKNELVSVVSHELRTPLTSIRGSLGLLEAGVYGTLPESVRRLATIGRSNTDRLIRLVNDLLDLEKLEAGRLELRGDAVDVAAVVAGSVEGVRTLGAGQGVHVQIAGSAPGRYTVRGDADRLTQVLTNLLSNAIKFSPPDGAVTVRLEQQVAGVVRLSVSDAGPGIAAHDVARLFQRFQQLDGSDARRYGGTGLGLAISKDLVEQHGGRIGVVSEPGEGACFWVELPCTAHSGTAHSGTAHADAAHSDEGSPLTQPAAAGAPSPEFAAAG